MSRGLLAASLLLGVAACASPKLEIREVGRAQQVPKAEGVSGRVALGLSQLALGNVGLAVESFRRAIREEPNNHQAMLGLAECYLAMGKPSLARRSIEQALALRPEIPELYRALAAAAEGEGKQAEAAELRREAELRAAGSRKALVDPPVAVVPDKASVTIDLTVKPLQDSGPRLVRLSLGEVALVTRARSPFGTGSRQADSTIHPPLRILNAARVQGIAAGTRTLLREKGIQRAEIGNFAERKERSELRFAKADRTQAEAIAARLPFKVTMIERAGPLVLLLGRDAAP